MTPSPQDHIDIASDQAQYLFIIRHGDRWDYSHPEWLDTAERRGDPPLSTLGHQQARETGLFLDKMLAGFTHDKIKWLSSPFLRTLQTSDAALNAFQSIDSSKMKIHPEYSIFEMDGHNGVLHKDLPTLQERKLYFPRIDVNYESLFVPELPEPRDELLNRCSRSIDALHQQFPFEPGTAMVMVTHAAACIGLSRAAANVTLQDVCAAGPCSVFRLTRTSPTNVWDLDPCTENGAMNGYMGHISDAGTNTQPWNHFGDKCVNHGYTGPTGMDPPR